ncbi:DUF2798 domain-containing protein [Fructobacillus parabroussonetiae]|uniref:DUF2798 domain-containing protein n=1 Tax=Fructobacillus parabroussonetiae TaxID=2713174 RepID=A0ABS5QWC3_9LACO|nr:DUF2798 domain-containing protein [Fructobacillus parabroussonetiae]MBS9337504.1 DUF2798 domain-containing protein [Fructobacillus parabroussonetiae]
MPRNLKEELFFMLIMAGLMVFGMSVYNVYLADGYSSQFWNEIIIGYPIALIVAMIADGFIVGPIAKGLAFKVIVPRFKDTEGLKIPITISLLMITGMVTLMSVFGLVINGKALSHYSSAWLLNLVLALPLQLLIVAPIARFALSKVQN